MYPCKGSLSAIGAFQRIIWNIKRQKVEVCFSEVASSVHGTPTTFTAKPPEMSKTGCFALAPQTNAVHIQ
jgi:hypothetical protein